MKAYARVLRIRDYRLLFVALVLNLLGDGASWTAMAWITVETAGAKGLGVLGVCYTLPVLVGGALIGPLLDRFSRRWLLIGDALLRAVAIAVIPLLAVLGVFAAWQLYLVAAVYGLLKIVPLAGVPAVLPELVPEEGLQAASGLEAIALGAAAMIGPAIGAALIGVIGAPNVLLLDAATYLAFALLVVAIRSPLGRPDRADAVANPAAAGASGAGWSPVFRLLVRDRFLLLLTLSFAAFNIAVGALLVAQPWLAKFRFESGPYVLAVLLAAFAGAELLGSIAAGALAPSDRQMLRIGVLQLLAGAGFLLLLSDNLGVIVVGLLVAGALSAPMTVFAGVVRLTRIPNVLRGRSMTLMRTVMSGALPLGSAIGGALLAGGHYTALVLVMAAVAALPGLLTAITFRNRSYRLRPGAGAVPAAAANAPVAAETAG